MRADLAHAVLIGSHSFGEVDLLVRDRYVSPVHAAVWRDDVGLWVADLGSTNGTWLEADPMALLASMPAAGGGRYAGSRRVRVTEKTRWRPGWTLWVGRSGLEQDHRGWVRAVSR